MEKVLVGIMSLLLFITGILIILAGVYGLGGVIFWGIGSFIVWAFGINFAFTFWHGLAIAFIVETLAMIFGGK